MNKLNDLIQELCPTGIEKVSLGSLMKRIKEKNYENSGITTVYSVTKDHGIVKSDDLHDFSVYSSDLSNYSILKKNQYAYNPARLNIGSIARLKNDEIGLVSPMYIIFELDQNKIDYNYFEHLLFSKKVFNDMCSFVEQGARFRFDYKNWDKIIIDLPPIQIQKYIVKTLNKFIEMQNCLEKELEARKSQYEFWREKLINNDNNNIELGDICKIVGRIGFRGYTRNDLVNSKEAGAISLSPGNIKDNHLLYNDPTYVSWKKYEESPEIMIENNDIIFCKTGSTVGKVALVQNLPHKATINPQLVVLKELKCNPSYLAYIMESRYFQNEVMRIKGLGSIPTISQKDLAKLKISLPSRDKQDKIANVLNKFNVLISDISEGLPAEIELRRKQYEYYRNKLLNFEEIICE